jgi:hypothetical protein
LPLVDAFAVELRAGDPLVWLAEVPTVETPTLQKAPLGGTTIKVAAAPGTLSDHGLYTNLALQAGSNPSVVAAVTGIMSASLAAAGVAVVAAPLRSPLGRHRCRSRYRQLRATSLRSGADPRREVRCRRS